MVVGLGMSRGGVLLMTCSWQDEGGTQLGDNGEDLWVLYQGRWGCTGNDNCSMSYPSQLVCPLQGSFLCGCRLTTTAWRGTMSRRRGASAARRLPSPYLPTLPPSEIPHIFSSHLHVDSIFFFFLLTRMKHQRNQIFVLLWYSNCTALYSLG